MYKLYLYNFELRSLLWRRQFPPSRDMPHFEVEEQLFERHWKLYSDQLFHVKGNYSAVETGMQRDRKGSREETSRGGNSTIGC